MSPLTLKFACALGALVLPILTATVASASEDSSPPSALALADRAFQQMQEKDWAGAVTSYAEIVRSNAYSASHWFNYGYALHKTGHYREAIPAMEKAIALGFGFDNKLWWRYIFTEEWWRSFCPRVNAPWYMIARAQACLGRKTEALRSLARALEGGFTDEPALKNEPDLASLRDDPRYQARFRTLVGVPPEGLSREEKWRFDLDFLARRIEQIHYAPYRVLSRKAFRAEFSKLKSQAAHLDDPQIITEITRILARIGDGHTAIAWPRSMWDFPIEFRLYSDGLFVYRAPRPLAETAGCRVVSIGGHKADEVLKAVEPYCSVDNAMGYRKLAPGRAANPNMLAAAGLIHNRTRVPLVVQKPDGAEITVELAYSFPTKDPWEPWTFIHSHAKTPTPLSLNVHDVLWFERVPETHLVYCQCNAIANPGDESFAAFFQRLMAYIEANEIDYLVLDLRNNNGGDGGLNKGLIHALIRSDRINRRGHLFVLIGRTTFSAAQNLTTTLEQETEAVFVGEPSGSCPNFVGQSTLFTLPCCGLEVSCSSLYHQRAAISCDFRTWVEPDIVAEISSEDARNNRDPAMEAVRKEIAAYPSLSR